MDRRCSSQFPAPERGAHPTGFFGAISTVLAEQRLGIKEVDAGIWLVGIIDYDPGYIDLKERTLQPLDNPVGPRLSLMSCARFVTHVSGSNTKGVAGARNHLDCSCGASSASCDPPK
jgi:hypothetical protein